MWELFHGCGIIYLALIVSEFIFLCVNVVILEIN
jgi:hypothetical protein